MAYFKPAHGLNPDILHLFEQNRLTVTRQVKFDPGSEDSIDMMLSLNGLPLATVELKNHLTGQNVHHAVAQYKGRDHRLKVFQAGVSANAVPAAYTSGSGVLDQRVSLPACLFGDRGEGISDILPSPGSEWSTELRRLRSQVVQLPRPLRLILQGVRLAHLLGLLLDEVHSELHRRAAVAGRLLRTIPETADDPVELSVIEALTWLGALSPGLMQFAS